MLKFYTKRFQKVTHIQFIFDKNFAFLSLIEMKMSNWIFFHLKIQHLNVTIEIFDGPWMNNDALAGNASNGGNTSNE